ncbi:MAG: DNA methyltransferase, partial [Candidatus Ornithospirochaeta sp.]
MSTKKEIAGFVEDWKDKGNEKSDTHNFWFGLLNRVLDVKNPDKYIVFEKPVFVGSQKYIDGYIPSTKVLIEQKSLGIDLDKKELQSDGVSLTPFEQGKRYNDNLPYSERARWIVVSNFSEFRIYDMEEKKPAPQILFLRDLQNESYRLSFMVDNDSVHIKKEMEVSIKAGDIIGVIYDKLLEQYNKVPNIDPDARDKSLNRLCVRLVFCFYAEDAGIFGHRAMFTDYINGCAPKDIRKALIELFRVLDQKPEERDPFLEDELAAFPYVNGGLFTEEDQMIPQFTEELKKLLVKSAGDDFDWSKISPTIFGGVFESTLNPETRRSGGMHYTSIENIHKVIDPLFLDDLKAELEAIEEIKVQKTRIQKAKEFKKKLSSLTFMDPACGSGNFLTETYLSLRRLENKCIRIEVGEQNMLVLEDDEYINVSIHQFYGIEINDFAVVVAKTALWIAESQMMKETEEILSENLDFLPLKSYANIVEGNALRIDWECVVPKEKLNYIMGNPPFVGQAMRSQEQANDMQSVFSPSKIGGKLDYVAGWFKKAADYMEGTLIETSFVSSNSLCQGESVNLLWEFLLSHGVFINFAYTTFPWTSEAKDQAAVMCIIVGFAKVERNKKLFFTNEQCTIVNHINGYLQPAQDVFIKNRSKSINKETAKVVQGSPPADDGRLILSVSEKDNLIKKYPNLDKVIRPFIGSREF